MAILEVCDEKYKDFYEISRTYLRISNICCIFAANSFVCTHETPAYVRIKNKVLIVRYLKMNEVNIDIVDYA